MWNLTYLIISTFTALNVNGFANRRSCFNYFAKLISTSINILCVLAFCKK